MLGCAGANCQDIQQDTAGRYVVLDMGSGQTPIVVFSEVSHASPNKASWLAQLDTVLSSIRFAS